MIMNTVILHIKSVGKHSANEFVLTQQFNSNA